MAEIRKVITPLCPGCDNPPMFDWVEPYFCCVEDCEVVCWDPYEPTERFKANAQRIDLSPLADL